MGEIVDKLTILNRALARIGAAPLTDLDADDDQLRQCLAIWEDLVDAALVLWSWSWSMRPAVLERRAETPLFWKSAFGFPATALGPPVAVYASADQRATPLRDFAVEGRTVLTDTDVAWARFPTRIDPADWPAAFRLGFTVWLASALAVPVAQDTKLKAQLETEALGTPSEGGRGGLIGRAIAMDAGGSGGPAPLGASDALTDAHMGDFSYFGR